jgi:hypothetical protein
LLKSHAALFWLLAISTSHQWQLTEKSSMKNFLGVLLSAGLLALGAPFWYNALKTLTSLRPQVATRHDQQRQEAAAS